MLAAPAPVRDDGRTMATGRRIVIICAAALLAGGAAVAGAQPAGEVIADRFARPQTPAVAVGPSGRAVIAWVSGVGDRYVVRARIRGSRTGPWAPPAALAPRSASRPSGPVAAVAPDGGIVVAWDDGAGTVLAARRPARGGAWQRLTVAADAAGFVSPGLTAAGGAPLAWA